MELRAWRYLAILDRFEERPLQFVNEIAPPSLPYEPGFSWHHTPGGQDRLLLEQFDLHRRRWRVAVSPNDRDRVTLAARRRENFVVVFPKLFPYEPPMVLERGGTDSWPDGFVWNSLRNTGELLDALEKP